MTIPRSILPLAFAALAALAPAAQAATYNVLVAGTSTLLGIFDAPATGGALTSASLSRDGGVFDVLGAGSTAPTFDPATGFVTAGGSGFGGVGNSAAFVVAGGPLDGTSCLVGECVFSFTSGSGGSPGEFYVDHLPGGGGAASIGFGFYEVVPAAIPLPAAAPLLVGALAALGLLVRRRAA